MCLAPRTFLILIVAHFLSKEDEVEDAKAASLAISCAHHGQDLFEPIIRGILVAMDGTAVAARTKALKGLMSIVTADYDVLALVCRALSHTVRLIFSVQRASCCQEQTSG